MSLKLNGSTSGYVEIDAPAVAGSTFITLPSTSGGEFIVTDSAGDLNVNNGTLFVDASSQRVGIGTTSPNSNLHIESNNYPTIRLKDSTEGGFALIEVSPGGGMRFRADPVNEGTTAEFIRFDTAASERARIDSSGRLLVGTSSARGNFFNSTDTALVQVEGANNNAQRYVGHIYGVEGGGGPWHIFAKHRSNSIGGTTVVIADDQVGALSFQGSDGTEFVEAARIEALVDGAPGSSAMPGRLVFSTNSGGASPTERMRIDDSGRVTMPYQPYALVYFQLGDVGAANNKVGPAQTKTVPTGIANNAFSLYSSSGATAGRFTAPVAGLYEFSFSADISTLTATGWIAALTTLNGSSINLWHYEEKIAPNWQYLTFSDKIPLSANDWLELHFQCGGGTMGSDVPGIWNKICFRLIR